MIVFGASVSPFVRKVLIVAAEKGVAVENRPVNPRSSDDADFLTASPFRKIPLSRTATTRWLIPPRSSPTSKRSFRAPPFSRRKRGHAARRSGSRKWPTPSSVR